MAGLERSKEAEEARPEGGERGARNGNNFEVQQAPELLKDLEWGGGRYAKVLVQYKWQASARATKGWDHLQV